MFVLFDENRSVYLETGSQGASIKILAPMLQGWQLHSACPSQIQRSNVWWIDQVTFNVVLTSPWHTTELLSYVVQESLCYFQVPSYRNKVKCGIAMDITSPPNDASRLVTMLPVSRSLNLASNFLSSYQHCIQSIVSYDTQSISKSISQSQKSINLMYIAPCLIHHLIAVNFSMSF